jgi:SAM-dependent methyltransferase
MLSVAARLPLTRKLRGAIPPLWRRRLRRCVVEAPIRARDILPDATDLFRRETERLPPARLRERGSPSSSRRDFETAGALAAADVLQAFDRGRRPGADYPRWLDFGCGCGRIARHLARAPVLRELHGVDVDPEAIAWLARRPSSGRFERISARPPTALAGAFFDVALAVSVFPRLDQAGEAEWLPELVRLLRPGGLLIASTLCGDPTSNLARESLASRSRVEKTWGRLLRVRSYRDRGLAGSEDLWVWEKAYRCDPPREPPRLPCRRWER